jgi:hypothetical protein
MQRGLTLSHVRTTTIPRQGILDDCRPLVSRAPTTRSSSWTLNSLSTKTPPRTPLTWKDGLVIVGIVIAGLVVTAIGLCFVNR